MGQQISNVSQSLLQNQRNPGVITITRRGKPLRVCSGMMYRINRLPGSWSDVTLTCNQCSHTVRINEFDGSLASRRTQAARAMLEHLRNQHRKEPIPKPKLQTMERWY